MRRQNFLYKKGKGSFGQSMVEFALVLPILLVLVFGLIEAGRLLFIYGSVTTASRQAVRYGSATGDNGSGTLKYLDCAGIQAAAEQMGFILPINNVDIIYTRGGTTFADCDTADSAFPDPSTGLFQNGDRIEVTTTSAYTPIVPIVPFGNFDITTESKRTIFIGITIEATPSTPGQTAELTLTKTANPTTFTAAGETITYSLTLTNSGDLDLTNYSVSDPMLSGFTCSGASIASGASVNCSGTYTITATDITNAQSGTTTITNTATATALNNTDTVTAQTSATITYVEQPHISLAKTPSPASTTTLGDTITYTYRITNDGNVNLTTFSVTDITDSGTVVGVSCPSSTTVAPGNFVDCTGTYTITQADLDAGSVTNTATAQATDGGALTSNTATASATVITKPLGLTITTSPNPYNETGEIVEFRYTLQNLGATPLSDFSIADSRFTGISCPSVTLQVAESTTCTYQHTVTQTDMDTGFIDVDSTGFADNGTISSALTEFTVFADQDPNLTLQITSNPADASGLSAGDTITYTYTITNTGDVSLATPYMITDDLVDTANIDCSIATTPIRPYNPPLVTDIATCTGTYQLTQDDINAGSITNTATVTANIEIPTQDGRTTKTSLSASLTLFTFNGPRLSLNKTYSKEADAGIGDIVLYTYQFTNTGNTILKAPYTVNDDILDRAYNNGVDCSGITYDLGLGQTASCWASYQIDARDVDANDNLTNTATVDAKLPDGSTVTSNSDTESFKVLSPATCSLTHSGAIPANTKFPSWTITNNSGTSVTVASITITWSKTNSDRKLKIINLSGHGDLWDSESNSGSESVSGAWVIGTGNTNLNLEFGKAPGTYVRAVVTFSDPVCSSTTLSSP